MPSSRAYQTDMQTFETSFQVFMPPAVQHQKSVILRKEDIEDMYRQITNIIHGGGAVFVGYFQTRQTTEDINYFPRRLEEGYGIDLVHQLNSTEKIWSLFTEIHIAKSPSTDRIFQNTVVYEDKGLKILATAWP
ncbi:uncharacterized protein BT62DRAFT_1004691 [Guyanagaster necrorhizus]|uniref:Uncharacterized protein n=1 Tax=Guyanagaster necrorhizus TaxID=856835 RepID=A0A9P7VWF1_9AGAR|nr:uncharacterized protein BT62DRAFT_1004691 [Guyanagaster necrorhizus MCA 3950]KAG7447116.1 hypothetical protein BT62DRAFT_1004691 [Guyanagaster necrorhizus MCA 3950]